MSYWRLYYHLVWGTKKKQPLITPELRPVIDESVAGKCTSPGARLHAIGGMPDHIHLVVSIPPTLALSEFVRQVKGVSSHRAGSSFVWQNEYGAFTVSERNLPQAIAYVRNQEAHHTQGRISPPIEAPPESP